MSSKMLTKVALMATAVPGLIAPTASAQVYDPRCNPCCTPMQPVLQTQYRTVPVTEMQPVKQTVKRPQYRTEYINEPVTTYRPVTERVVRNVPSVQYQTVTQYRTVHRDMGRWVTSYQPNPRLSPCQVDGRPGFVGWMNRTRHELVSAFKPRYTSSRHYQPNVVAYSVPHTRQVAVPTTRQVAYNTTRMVPTQTVQRRAVQRLSYVDEEVTVMRPRTTYRTVPIGTTVAYAPGGSSIAYGGSTMATAPGGYIRSARVIDDRPIGGSSRTALNPEPDDNFSRSARSNGEPERAAEADLPDPSGRRDVSAYQNRGGSLDRVATSDGFSQPIRSVQPVGRLRRVRQEDRTGGSTLYERPEPGATGSSSPAKRDAGEEPDPFGADPFELNSPSASIPRVREADLRTTGTTEFTGWKPSRSVRRTHRVTKPVFPEITSREIARR